MKISTLTFVPLIIAAVAVRTTLAVPPEAQGIGSFAIFRGVIPPEAEVTHTSQFPERSTVRLTLIGDSVDHFELRVYNADGRIVCHDTDLRGGCTAAFTPLDARPHRCVITNLDDHMSNYQLFID